MFIECAFQTLWALDQKVHVKLKEALNIALVVLERKCSLNVLSKHFGSLIKGYMLN